MTKLRTRAIRNDAPIVLRPGVIEPDPFRPRVQLTRDMVRLAAARVPAHPALRDWLVLGGPWGMLDNDEWGDCVEAGLYHAVQALTGYTLGKPVVAADGDADGLYAAITGFRKNAGPPGNNPTDQGTDPLDAFSYWRKTGITVTHADGTKETHKILAYAEVDVNDRELVAAAVNIFGVVFVTLDVPQFAMDQFNNHEPWSIPAGNFNTTDLGGHFIIVGAYSGDNGTDGPTSDIGVTWGSEQEIFPDFWHKYMTGAYVVAPDHDWFLPTGDTPSGLDAHAFGEAFAEVTGEPNPWPNDTPPAPDGEIHWDTADAAFAATADPWSRMAHVGANRRAAAAYRAWRATKHAG